MSKKEIFFCGFLNNFSCNLDGIDDHVVVGSNSSFNYYHGATNPTDFAFTISIWVRLDDPNSNAAQIIFDNCNASTANVGISLIVDSRASLSRNRSIQAYIHRGVTSQPVIQHITANSIYPNTSGWVHILWTYDQSLATANSNIYINNNLVSTANKTTFTPSTSNALTTLCFSKRGVNSDFYLKGNIYHPIFINKVLNAPERLELFTSPYKKATDFSFGVNVTNAFRFPYSTDSFPIWQDYVGGINGTMTNQTASNISPDIPNLQDLPAYGIWSLRKINPSSSVCIQVTRSSDNTTMDIGYDANGNLDEVQLLNFVGSGNGTIRQWYDQSGSGNHFLQTTISLQPQIVVSGIIQKDNGKPTVISNGTRWMQVPSSTSLYNFLHQGQGIIVQVLNYTNGATRIPLANANTSANRGFIAYFGDSSPYTNAAQLQISRGVSDTYVCSFSINNAITPGKQTLQISIINCIGNAADRGKIYVDDSPEYTGNIYTDSISTLNASNNLMLFRRPVSTSLWMVGGIQETIIYANNVKSIETIKQELNSYYNIY